jgi:hypothetical protein
MVRLDSVADAVLMKALWHDPVWSKVIAGVILAVTAAVGAYLLQWWPIIGGFLSAEIPLIPSIAAVIVAGLAAYLLATSQARKRSREIEKSDHKAKFDRVFEPKEDNPSLTANVAEKLDATRLELVDLEDALGHINRNFVRIYETRHSMEIRNFAFDLELTAPWLIRNLKNHPSLTNMSYNGLAINGAVRLIEEITGGDSDIRIDNLTVALDKLWAFVNQEENTLKARDISIEIRAYDLPPIIHGFILNDQYLYLGLTHIENGKVKGSIFPYWYLQFDKTRTTVHLFNVYNSWFKYTWKRSHPIFKFSRTEKFYTANPSHQNEEP